MFLTVNLNGLEDKGEKKENASKKPIVVPAEETTTKVKTPKKTKKRRKLTAPAEPPGNRSLPTGCWTATPSV